MHESKSIVLVPVASNFFLVKNWKRTFVSRTSEEDFFHRGPSEGHLSTTGSQLPLLVRYFCNVYPSSSDNENDEKDNYLSSDVNKLSDEDALSSSDDDQDNTYKHSNRSSVRGRGAGVHNNFRGGGGHLRGDNRNNVNSYRDVGSYNYGELEDTVDPRDLVDDTRVRRRLSRRESDEWYGADGSSGINQQQNSNSRNNGVLPKSSPTTTGGTNNNKSSRGSKRENLNHRDGNNAKSLLMQLEQSGTNNGRKAYGSNSGKKERGGYNNHGGGITAGAFGGNMADNLHYGPGSSPLEDGSSYAAPHQRHGNNNRPGYELNYDYENNYDNEQELNNYNYNPNKLSGVKKHTSAKGMNNNNKHGTRGNSTNNSNNKSNNSYNNWEEQSQASSAFSGNRNNKMQHRGGNGNAAGGGPLQEMNNFEESNWARESVDREMQDWMTQNNLQHLRNAAATGSASAAAAAAAAVVVGQDYAFPSTAEMPFFTYADAIKEKQRAAEAAGEKPKLVIAPAPGSSSANNALPVSALGQAAPAKSGPPTRAPPKQQAAAGVVTTISSSGATGPPSRLAPPPAISPPTAENVPSLSGLPVVKQTSKTAVIMSTTSGASSSGSASYEEVAIGSAHASAQQKLEKKQIILEDGRVLDTLEVISECTRAYL